MERPVKTERWQGQVELGAAIDKVNVLDFLEVGGNLKRDDIESEIDKIKDEPEPEPQKERDEWDDDHDYDYEPVEGKRGTPKEELARSIRATQRKVDRMTAGLDRKQRKDLAYLLTRAKEGGVRFWKKTGDSISPLIEFGSFVSFATENKDAEHLHIAGEFLKKGVYYLRYSSTLAPHSSAQTAKIALSHLDDIKKLSNRQAPPQAFARIEEFLAGGGSDAEIKKYIEKVSWLKQELGNNHLRLENDFFDILTPHVEHAEYREQLATLDSEEIGFTAKALKKFIHPSKFRTAVGAREFLAVADFVKRNKTYFEEAVAKEKDWTDLSADLKYLFKAPSEKLSEVSDRELFDKYSSVETRNAKLLGSELCRQFPEIEEMCHTFGIDVSELTDEAGNILTDILLKFSETTDHEGYFINRDYERFRERDELFTRFAIVGNFAKRLLNDGEKIEFIKDNFKTTSLGDVFFIGTLLQENEDFYTKRTEALTGILGEKLDVTNSIHYHLLYHKVHERWGKKEGEIENLKMVVEVMGKDTALPFTPKDLEANLGGRYEGRETHYGLAWYFGMKSRNNDQASEEQRGYLHDLERFYSKLDRWEGDRELLEGAKEDGVFEPPFGGNLLHSHEITILYDMPEPARTRLAEVIGYPKYDFGDTKFYVLANAALGHMDQVFTLFKDGKEIEAEFFEAIKRVLPEESKDSLKEAAQAYFEKMPRPASNWDEEGKTYPAYQMNAITESQLALLEHIYREDKEGLERFIANHLKALDSDDLNLLKPHTMSDGLLPVLKYALAHRAEGWVDKDVCIKLVGEGYYDIYHAKNFVFEQRIRDKGITEDNWLLAYCLMYDRHGREEFSYYRELAGLMNTEEARNLLRSGVRNLFLLERNDPENQFGNKVKEEMQSLVYLEPKYVEKILPGIDVENARDNFEQPYSRFSDRNSKEFVPWSVTKTRDDILLRLEYLLEPEDRQMLYTEINNRLVSAVREKLEDGPESDHISIHDLLRFIEDSPIDTSWVDREALKTADFAFDHYGAGKRFTEYYKEALPLSITSENWASLLNLFTYQTEKTLEGYNDLEAFIKNPETLQKLNGFAKERFTAYLDGDRELQAQEKILLNYLTGYRAQDHAADFESPILYAQQITFLETNQTKNEEAIARAFKKCLDVNGRDAYILSASLVAQVASFLREARDEDAMEGLDDMFEYLFSQDSSKFFETMRDENPHSSQLLMKKIELMVLMNRYSPDIGTLLGNPLPLDKSLQFVSGVLKDSVENVKRLRFLADMSPEYMEVARTALENSPKDFLQVLDLLNVAKTFEMPFTQKFADFVSRLPNLSPDRLVQLYKVIDKEGIAERRETRKKSVEKRIDRVQKRLEVEQSGDAEKQLEKLLQELTLGSDEKDHFLSLVDRLKKAGERSDTRTEDALKKEMRDYLTPILIRGFAKKVTGEVMDMIKEDFGLDSFDFNRVNSGDFTSAYRMYKRLFKDNAGDASKAKVAIARYLKDDKSVVISFPENRRWIERNISTESTRGEFMSPNKREYEVGNMTGSDIDGQVDHFMHEARRCLTTLKEVTGSEIAIPDNTNEAEYIRAFRDLRGKEWNEEQRPIYDDLKVQIDALEQLMTLRHARGTLPKRISIEREIDPIKITQMGTVVNGSCLHADGFNYWSTFTNAIEANKMLFWVKDESGNVLARVLCAVDADKNIVRFPAYYTGASSLNANLFFNQYLRDFGEKYGFGLNGNKNTVANLVMSRWYKDPEVEVE